MMKSFVIVCILLSILGCSSTKISSKSMDSSGNLIGIITKKNLENKPFSNWFDSNFNEYKPDSTTIKALKPLLKNVTIKAFMGTWCSDSQMQTPVLYKILDECNFNYSNLKLIGLNEKMKTSKNLQKGFNIKRVPTFILYKKGIEIGRFVEFPRESVEADLLKIVSGKPYKHSYQN